MADRNKRDYYEVLGVDRGADAQNMKQTYRRLALKYHPDRNPGDNESEAKFKEISEAYQVLSDPEKRQAYDRFGHAGLSGSGFQPFSGFEEIFESFGDIFGDFFGGGQRARSRAQKGEDLRYDITLDFMEAVQGTSQDIEVEKLGICEPCSGSGAKPGTSPVSCPQCNGSGQVRRSQGFFVISTTCNQCRGTGQTIEHPCDTCRGFGRVEIEKRLNVKIPAGVDRGSHIRLRGEGEPGHFGGPSGDLYIVVNVKPHDRFARHGDDLYLEIPITFSQAALGGHLDFPTIEGDESREIPRGTQTGHTITLRGKGVPNLRGYNRGDLHVKVVVITPTKLTPRHEEIFKELADLGGEEFSPKKKSIFEKIRESIG